MGELLYKELSYKIVGIAFEVHNTLGSNLKEKVYADAFEKVLKDEGVAYKREFHYPLKVRGETVGKRFFDFLVDDKIIVELKVGFDNYRETCNQIYEYLSLSKLKLGLIIRFTKNGVKTKRVVNLY